jgi:hypothetical protein
MKFKKRKRNSFSDPFYGSGFKPRTVVSERENIWTDGETEYRAVHFPDVTIANAEFALLHWIATNMRGDSETLKNIKVRFVGGDRWALMRESEEGRSIITKDGVPVLPQITLARESIKWGNSVERKTYNGLSKIPFKKFVLNSGGEVIGYKFIEIQSPIPFEVSFKIDFWVTSPAELNEVMIQFWESVRNRNAREATVIDPKTGWTYQAIFEDTMQYGDNLGDFNSAQRIVRTGIGGTLFGMHLRDSTARQKEYGSINQVGFEVQTFTESDSKPVSGDSAPFPVGEVGEAVENQNKGFLEGMKGSNLRDYLDEPKIQLVESGKKGEKIYKIVS